MNVYLNRPELVLKNEADFKNLKFLDDNKIVKRPKKEDVISLSEPEAPVENLNEGELIVGTSLTSGRHKGNGYAQFTQHYNTQIIGIKVVKVQMLFCQDLY